MLARIHIENFAIAEATDVRFERGMNAITGETGAGKSIIVGALELALGGRASAEVVRSGARVAVVEVSFEAPFPAGLREMIVGELGLEWESREPLLLRREISAQGRSRCMIAGQLVNVSDLKRAGDLLADLHGQHEHQSLFHASAQRAALDAYGDYDELLKKYEKSFGAFTSLERRQRDLAEQARDFDKRLDYLTFQIDELEAASPREQELAELESEEARLAHVETLAQAAARAYAILYEGNEDESRTVVAALAEVARELDQIARLDPGMRGLDERISEIQALIHDLSSELRHYVDQCEPDPERLNEVIGRIEAYRRLYRKHSVGSEAELIEILKNLREERDRMNLDERERNEIDEKIGAARKELGGMGEQLFRLRTATAKKFSSEIMKTLAHVGMEKAEFIAEVCKLEEFGPHGADRVEFLLAANVGEGAKPLGSVASGGELSRTMLAIKAALAARGSIPTLVFDEIDAGISGQTAARVGRLMEKLGASHQIICITHHASIAARAGHHLSVRKATHQGRTSMSTIELGEDERVEELARMMGDETQSSEGRKLAKKLMGAA